MTRNPNLKLTTVLIVEDFKDPLAVDNIKTKMSLQKIVNRCLHLYLTDDSFKEKIINYNELVTTGSL